ncbi:MAG TPA: hypothetical protein VG429_10745 [Casimicrobiaceae bacterium]|jgi:hypothetical protein|nr:hypothetical protein [Casimicrobiaceae bacterium]
MNILTRALRGLIALFVDDGKLALTVIGVLIGVGLLTHFGALGQSLGMALLVAGTISALLANVIHAASTTKR